MQIDVTTPGTLTISQAQWDSMTVADRQAYLDGYAAKGYVAEGSAQDDYAPTLSFGGGDGSTPQASTTAPPGAYDLISPGSDAGTYGANNSVIGASSTDIPGLTLPSLPSLSGLPDWLNQALDNLAQAIAAATGLDKATAKVLALMALGFGVLSLAVLISGRRR